MHAKCCIHFSPLPGKRNTFISFSSFINIFMASKSFFPFRRKILPSWKHILCSFFSFVKKTRHSVYFAFFFSVPRCLYLKYKHFHRSHSSVPFGEKFSPYGYTFSRSKPQVFLGFLPFFHKSFTGS